jgi:hypothetical protein
MVASRIRTVVASLGVLVGSCALAPSASAALTLEGWGSTITPLASSEEPVFVYTRDTYGTCPNQFPDAPVRAFKDAGGNTQLILANTTDDRSEAGGSSGGGFNFRMIGTNLNNVSVEPNCHTILTAGMKKVPDNFDNQEWLTSPYAMDNGSVYALVHNEYHAWEYGGPPDQCASGAPGDGLVLQCWYNSITLAKSENGGISYSKVLPAPNHRVATFPYKWEPDKGPSGYFQPTNIVKNDDFYYAMFRAEPGGGNYPQQTRGLCLMRTRQLDDPTSWRAWDGTDFGVSFVNPYDPSYDSTRQPPEQHLCTPVASFDKIGAATDSLTYNTYFDAWMLVGIGHVPDPANPGQEIMGAFYTLSNDLIHWTDRKLLAKARLPWDAGNTACDRVSNYSVLDPNSTDRNYGTTGQVNYLYYMVSHERACTGIDGNRDIVRIPFRFQYKPKIRWAMGGFHTCAAGFDSANPFFAQPQASFLLSRDRNYTVPDWSYKADTSLGGPSAYGILERDGDPAQTCEWNTESPRIPLAFGEGDEVRFSGAFVFPTTGFWDKIGADGNAANVTIMKLSDGATGWAAAVTVNKDGLVRFNTRNSGAVPVTQMLPNNVYISKDSCWHFFDVYQKLSSDPAKAQNQIWIDRRTPDFPVSNAPNLPAGSGPYRRIRAGIVERTNASNVTLYADQVGLGYPTSPLWYVGCQGVHDGVPPSP